MGERDDAVLVAAQLGQAWALTALYDSLAPAVAGYLRSRGASDPDDLTSEVFLAVFPRLPTVTGGPAGLRTLTFTVAHGRLVDDLRRQSRRPPAFPYDPDRDGRTAPSAEDQALDHALPGPAGQAMSRLAPDQQEVLALRVVADLSLQQTARAMGRSTGAVKQLQRRALLALRGELGVTGRRPPTITRTT